VRIVSPSDGAATEPLGFRVLPPLAGGAALRAAVAEPASGPPSGGTRVRFTISGGNNETPSASFAILGCAFGDARVVAASVTVDAIECVAPAAAAPDGDALVPLALLVGAPPMDALVEDASALRDAISAPLGVSFA
jgi:hypothetical protein